MRLTPILQVDLSRNNIGGYWDGSKVVSTPEGPKAIADALRVSTSVTSLLLEYNSLGDEGVTAICEAVQSNKETKLASLDIQYTGVGPAGAKSVAAMVAVIPSITQVCHFRKVCLHALYVSITYPSVVCSWISRGIFLRGTTAETCPASRLSQTR